MAFWAVLLFGSGLWHKRQYFSHLPGAAQILSRRRHSPE